ncbi:hypothetical protein MF410_27940 (plasmid) [Rhizobium sp. C104]|nr:hypothetical protein [Rhizobium sp. C104]ULJ81688.1 hypothetical protein MF410_27940 [Rhizobium sp. C104]
MDVDERDLRALLAPSGGLIRVSRDDGDGLALVEKRLRHAEADVARPADNNVHGAVSIKDAGRNVSRVQGVPSGFSLMRSTFRLDLP